MSLINDSPALAESRDQLANTPGHTGSTASSDHSPGNSSPHLSSSPATSVAADEGNPELAQDPSVITGMAFRLPGAKTLTQLWDNVVTQKDLQQKIPSDRFNVDAFYNPQGVNKGTTNARYGYFLEEPLTQFDNEFFRISRQEAESMDPQQRLLLEVVYEALEDAGIPLSTIRGSRTSVMVGSFTNDYNSMTTKDLATYPKYNITGTGNSILSNRISYFYDLHGPSLTVDTACSSSLVCFHLSNQSLRNGESDIAIVAGSSLHFDPNIYITMTDFGMLSTDGRCRSFDRDGSGYVRGEGVCAMVLKRQSSAEAAGDRIRAIVRGTGSNHDGSKSGLTLPNGAAQAQLIRQVYKDSGLDLDGTDYFEAHGTGTKAGDPIEANAIGSVFGSGRDRPLYLGSIKSNLGHLEGASGLAGIAKAVLSVSSGKILPNMHFNNPNPDIDFEHLKLKVPTELIDWPSNNRGFRRASVNSFGYGGSNAHVVLENYAPDSARLLPPSTEADEQSASRPFLVPLTAHNDGAAKNNVITLKRFTDQNRETGLVDIAHSYSTRRSKLQLRSYAIGSSHDALISSLDGLGKWISPLNKPKPRLGFVFTGQGAQWFAMGRELIEKSPLFRQTIEKCDQILAKLPDKPQWSVLDELLKSKETSRLGESLLSQPLCAALQLAIVDLLKQWGIVPSAVVGHSSGEIAAAYAAGILSFRNAIICAYYRGLYMSEGNNLPQKGAMLAVGMTASEGRTLLEPYAGRIALAAVNSPTSLTLSGDEDAVVELKASLDTQGVFNRRLRVEQAFHSHHMVPLAPGFESALSKTAGFTSGAAQVRMVSSVTARDSSARAMDAAYWAANMTGVVRFADALTGILFDENDESGVDILLEIGAHPALKGPSLDVVKSAGLELPYVGSLTRDKPAFESLLACAGELHGLGYDVDLAAANSQHSLLSHGDKVEKHTIGQIIRDLPAYAWDHGTHWAETRVIRQHRLRQSRHTLLGAVVPGSVDTHPLWRNYIKLSEIPWLTEHVVQGKTIFPGAGYISMALEAVASVSTGARGFQLRDVSFKSALVLTEKDPGTEILLELQPLATSAKSTSKSWYIFSISTYDDRENLVEHCRGEVLAEDESQAPAGSWSAASLAETRLSTDRRKPSNLHYKQLRSVGLDYGENFRLLTQQIESGPAFSLANLTFDPSKVVAYYADQCIIHPTTLDSAFHAIFTAIETRTGKPISESYVPTFIRSARFSGSLLELKKSEQAKDLVVHCNTDMPGTRVAYNTLDILDSNAVDGQHEVLVQLSGLEVTALGNESADAEERRNLFFNINWAPLFSDLGKSGNASNAIPSNIGEVVALFAHEVPDSSILHLTSSKDAVAAVLSNLGGSGGQDRKFGGLNIWSEVNAEAAKAAFQSLEPGLPGLLENVKPVTNQYDLVVLEESYELPVAELLKPEAFVITSGEQSLSTDAFAQLFSGQDFAVWKTIPGGRDTSEKEALTILTSANPSPETQAILSGIISSYLGPVDAFVIGTKTPETTSVLSLASLDDDALFDAETEGAYLKAIQALVEGPAENIVWLTRDAAIESRRPEQAVINGLFRSVRSENDGSRFATLDLDSGSIVDASYISQLTLRVLFEVTKEDELAERNGTLHVPRAAIDSERNGKLPFDGNRQIRQAPLRREGRPLALKIGKPGLLDTLAFDDDEDLASPELPDDYVEIEVHASALNSRDVAAATGASQDHRLGDEAAGVVIRTGKNISLDDFKPGDRVVALRPGQGAHRTLVRNPAKLTHKIDDATTFELAASFPLALATAHYSLYNVGRLQQGEYVLVHAATSSVGQMAVQLAKRVGAHVIATVSSPEKRAYLAERFGIADDFIFSSRDDSFVQGVLSVTGGRGADVALNSLTGELLHKTWAALAPLGRLIEIGKRDIHENTKLEMDPFRNGVTYASVDTDTLFRVNPELLGQLLRQSFALIQNGDVEAPGPIQTFTYGNVKAAFRTLQAGKSVGKIILVPDDNELVPVIPPTYSDRSIFSPEKSYLLVGGLGGIGRSLAEWLFRRGARKIAFLSRSGAKTRDAQDTVSWLHERGAETFVFKANADRFEEVKSVIDSLGDTLGGIFQAAMVLRDAPFGQLTADDWRQCVHPKTLGTRNLHVASEGIDLDFFVAFSSMSSVVGTAGQSNYSAANSYIDALMAHRRAHGLAGTTMNVGVVGDVGAVAEDDSLAVILDRMGYDFISQNELFYQVEEAVLTSKLQLPDTLPGLGRHQIISGINTKRKDVYWGAKALFRNLYSNLDLKSNGSSKGTESLTALLSAASSFEERVDILTTAFIAKVSAVMGLPVDSIQKAQPLTAYGLDSIVAVEFRKWFSTAVSADVPLFDILGSKSIKALVTKAVESLQQDESQNTSADAGALGAGAPAASPTKKGKRKGGFEIQPRAQTANTPLSSYQSRLWFLHNFSADQSTLNFVATFFLQGQPQVEILQKTFEELALRNDILRTIYVEGDDFTEQIPAEKFTSQIEVLDITSASDTTIALNKATNDLRNRSIDLEVGESMNVQLIKLAENKHALVMSAHHINLDNGSTKTILDQFSQIYNGIAAQKDLSKISVPRLSYADFSVWHNQLLSTPAVAAHLDWWKENLAGIPDSSKLLPFSSVKQRPSNRATERVTLETSVPSSVLKRLKRISSASNATSFHFLIAAFRAFIHRYTEEEDLTFLIVDGTRPHIEVSEIMGFFVNLVPLRLRLEAGEEFETLLSQVSKASFDALAHNSVPFDTIIDNVGVRRSTTHFPISQIMVNYQIYGKPPVVHTADFDIVDMSVQDIPSPADLSLEATEDPAVGLALKLQYDQALYKESEIERFLENFTVFLADVTRDHRQPINEVSLTGSLELEYLREHCWGLEVTADLWQDKSIVNKVLDFAHSQPTSIAIETSSGERITYGEIVDRAKKVSLELESIGISVGSLVGLLYKPSIDMIVAMLGIIFAGAGYLPLDPDFAKDRLKHMVEGPEVPVILTQREHKQLASELASGFAKVHTVGEEADQPAAAWTEKQNSASDPFYVIYTSGSTGKPKGVVLTRANTRAMLSAHNTRHGFSSEDRILFVTSFTWDVSVAQIWGSLTSGATMLLAKEDARKNPDALASFLLQSQATVTYTTPTQYASLLLDGKDRLSQIQGYRAAILAGEALSNRLVKDIYDLGVRGLKVYNQFGPSEATVQTTCHEASYPENVEGYIPIGYGLPNCSHYVVDSRLKPVPATVLGELCEGGPQVGAGYIGRPDATAEVYVENPFASPEYYLRGWNTVYRTGDRARFLPDGQLEYKGRIAGDTQVKLRGFRIELGEIENEITAIAEKIPDKLAAEAAVICRRFGDTEGASQEIDDRQLIAFLVTPHDHSQEEKQSIVNIVSRQLKDRLNYYMVPNAYHFTTSLPTLPSGKRNRRALHDVDLKLVYPVSEKPSTNTGAAEVKDDGRGREILETVTGYFRKVLKLQPDHAVSPNTSFFDLGGHSLLVLRLAAQIKKELKVKIEVKDIFSDLTPLAVSRVVAAKLGVEFVAEPESEAEVDWKVEASLPDEAAFYPVSQATEVGNIDGKPTVLLTGADSITGVHLLARLLDVGATRIAAVGTDSPLTHESLQSAITSRGLAARTLEELVKQVELLPGSLAEPNFGLDDAAFQNLGRSLQTIYHFGSQVSLLKSYVDLKAANVSATKDVIRLAALRKDTSVHYLSSWSVLHLQLWATSNREDTSSIVKDERSLNFFTPTGSEYAYFKTRWAAETLLSEAAKRGIPSTIYRSSGLDDNSSGKESNFYLGLIRDMVDRRTIPDFGEDGFDADFVTGDYVVDTILRLGEKSQSTEKQAQVFHIHNPSPVSLRDLPQTINSLSGEDHTFSFVSVDEWLSNLEKTEGINGAVMKEYIKLGHRMFSLDDTNTRRVLGEDRSKVELLTLPLQFWG